MLSRLAGACRAADDPRGQARCLEHLGDIALYRSDHEAARQAYQEALALYQRISDPYSIGLAHHSLARVTAGEERTAHVAAARAAWLSIDRADLLANLDRFS